MADKKISQLTSLAQGDIATTTDVLAIVDTSATETKKATPAAIVGAAAAAGLTNVDINSGAIDGTTIGANSAAAGTFTNLTASGTVSFSGATVSNGGSVTTVDINGGTIDGASVGASSASSGAFTTLSASGNVTLSGGTANGVLYLNGSKVATSGSALTFDGTNLGVNGSVKIPQAYALEGRNSANSGTGAWFGIAGRVDFGVGGDYAIIGSTAGTIWGNSATNSELMRLTSTGLGIGTSSPGAKFVVSNAGAAGLEVNPIGGVGGGSTIATYNRGTSAYTTLTTYSSAMTWYANGSTRAMDLDSSGNLGIGTSSPGAKLTIAQSSNAITQGLLLVNAAGTQNGGWYHGGSALIGRENGFDTIALAAGNVGIGTSSPAGRLSVKGSTADSSANALFVENSSGAAIFRVRNDGDLYMGSGGKAILDSSGNLGLGITPQSWNSTYDAIQIGSAGLITSRAVGSGIDNIQIGVNWYRDTGGTFRYSGSGAGSDYTQTGGAHQWFTAPSGTAGNAISFTQAMTLDASGNLGVGTTSPSTRLHVEVTNTASSGTAAAIIRQNGAGNNGMVVDVASTPSNYVSDFRINNSSVMRLDASGNLGVGTTSPITSAGGGLTVGSTSSGKSIAIYSSDNGNNGLLRLYQSSGVEEGQLYAGNGTLTLYSSSVLRFGTNNLERARIDASGNLLVGQTSWNFANNGTQIAASGRIFNTANTDYNIELAGGQGGRLRFYTSSGGSGTTVGSITVDATNTQYNTSSDRRLKQNIIPCADAGVVIDQIEVVEFDWKSGSHTRFGMIAQDLHLVAPEAVKTGDDGEEVTDAWGVDYSKLVPMLVKEIQSLRARVAQLEAK